MQIGHTAIPSTWTVTQSAKGSMLSGWCVVKNDVDGPVAYFRHEVEAEKYREIQQKGNHFATLIWIPTPAPREE